ncbi:MAG: hypothetical protein ABIX28_22715 [Vicinamibacterales bacterium]
MAHDLVSDEGLRAACEAARQAYEQGDWNERLARTIEWVSAADHAVRATPEFQWRLWEDNEVAAIGQGRVPVKLALDDASFRDWVATESLKPLPTSHEQRLVFLTTFYETLKERLTPFLDKRIPHLKIFRVMAALFPEAMTTIASTGALDKLVRAMGQRERLEPVERHLWVRQRLDTLLGGPSPAAPELAARMSLPWMLHEGLAVPPAEVTEKESAPGKRGKLVPLPAVRRRRGLTAIRGLFPSVITTLEYVRERVTRADLLAYLGAASPELKQNSLGVVINVIQSELNLIRLEGDRYVLTPRGEDVLESQDPSHLADWLLTHTLGVDRALLDLRENGPLRSADLMAAVKSMNPGWTSSFAPSGLLSWLRSMGVIHTDSQSMNSLTEVGREWASRIDWTPEPLPSDPVTEAPELVEALSPVIGAAVYPGLAEVIGVVQSQGAFPGPLIERLHAGLWSHQRRHFAVLTGLSGAGKTLLARAYAKAITVGGTDAQRFTLPVQPGWYDPGALLGYKNPLRDDVYVRTGFLQFLMAAVGDPTRPYVAVLDEMNLSHPEQYMAPLLSAMETGDVIRLHAEAELLQGVPESLPYPNNLVLIGTVNMDETTHGLSDKVLDRAFVLEFWEIDLDAYPHWGTRGLDASIERQARDVMAALMLALSPARLHFGWRVVDDVLTFLKRSMVGGGTLSTEQALDAVIYAKVLPKLRGEDTPRFREALTKCEDVLLAFGLVQSRVKVGELRHDLETTGSARFWR